MKYYKLQNSIDEDEIGYYPQSDTKSFGNLRTLNYSLPITDLIAPELIINPKATPTTYLYGGAISTAQFLVLRNDFIELIGDFITSDFKSWNLKVYHKNKILNEYSLFRMEPPHKDNFIDFRNSEFYVTEFRRSQHIKDHLEVKNYSEFIKLLDDHRVQNQMVRCKKLKLDLSKADQDFFRMPRYPLANGYYVSERLRDAILEKKFTGMRFTDIQEVDNRVEVEI